MTSGRSRGKITVRHRGGGAKRLYRVIDFKRGKRGIAARVEGIERDPNRSVAIALLLYGDGERRYILAPEGLSVGDKVIAQSKAEVAVGNAMEMRNIPLGYPVHNIEITPGRGGQLAKAAGTAGRITAKEGDYVQVHMPSGEIRRLLGGCFASLGRLSLIEHKTRKLGKAGRKRHLGFRPTVRGVAMSPRDHPHGGGEGRSGVGLKAPKSPWGKRTLGVKTRRRTHTDKYIIKRRK